MGTVKIKMNTWDRRGNRETKFKRNVAPREAFIEFCDKTKKVTVKNGETKWKPWDTTISRKTDTSYIESRKEIYSGLCFKNIKDALAFMKKQEAEMKELAAQNPLFDHWSVMNVIKRFEPNKKVIYGVDVKED